MCFFFFFKQKTAYEMRISDWSSDVCSSDLHGTDAICAFRPVSGALFLKAHYRRFTLAKNRLILFAQRYGKGQQCFLADLGGYAAWSPALTRCIDHSRTDGGNLQPLPLRAGYKLGPSARTQGGMEQRPGFSRHRR